MPCYCEVYTGSLVLLLKFYILNGIFGEHAFKKFKLFLVVLAVFSFTRGWYYFNILQL